MESDLPARAAAFVATILTATHAHAFDKAVDRFIDLLARVPDAQAGSLSEDHVKALMTSSEEVIARIEERVAGDDDSPSEQQRLVKRIYEIRARLEEIDRWRRHYLKK